MEKPLSNFLGPRHEVGENKNSLRCRVAWKNKVTGSTGNGKYMTKEEADAWMRDVADNRDIKHWLEQEPEK